MNDSGGSGSGQVLLTSATSFTVILSVKGLAPNSRHVSHLHKGGCGNIGPIAVALEDAVADSSGKATVATSLTGFGYGLPSEGWYANVHAGPDLTGANAKSILCGNLPAP